jgi:putative DNA primase/helicase
MAQTLSEHHRRELHASGLTDETIEACGFYTENCPNRLGSILLRKWHKSRGDGLVIPFRDSAGNVNGYKRVKPISPRRDRNGRAIKYESPRGTGNRAFFPPGVLPFLDDPEVELLIVEGEKKSAAGSQEGFPTIGLIGVYGWKEGRKADRLIPDLDCVAWSGRRVVIVYDSDLADKPEVQDAESRLAQQLANRGAIVKVCRLPDGPDGEKQGLDDFLLSAGRVELRKRLDAAEDPAPPDGTDAKIAANQIDAMPEARIFLDKVCTHEGILTLRCQHDEFLAWNELSYVPMADAELKARLWRYLDPFVSHLTSNAVNNVVAAVKACTLVPARQPMPAWLDGKGEFPADEVLATKSGLLHLPSLVAGKPSLMPLTPRFFSQTALDYKFDSNATCTTWLEFLDSLWPDDPESIESLQQLFGYLLLPDTRHHKLFMLVGPRRSGKGTIGRVIKSLVGPENLASPTLASLSGPFGLWPLLNRSVALIADARLSGRTDAVTIVERLLSISGEDPQDVHRKNLPTITGVRLPVRFVILTNELPSMRDASGAFLSRVILLRMTESFYGREDKRMTEKLLQELPGILNWSICGWQLLQQAGAFAQPASAQELLDDLGALSSPITTFIEDCCEMDPHASAPAAVLFAAWRGWCQQHGRDHVGTLETFGKDLRAAATSISRHRPRGTDGRRESFYGGIRVRSEFK